MTRKRRMFQLERFATSLACRALNRYRYSPIEIVVSNFEGSRSMLKQKLIRVEQRPADVLERGSCVRTSFAVLDCSR